MTRPPTPTVPRLIFALALAAVNLVGRVGEAAIETFGDLLNGDDDCCGDPVAHDHIEIGDQP